MQSYPLRPTTGYFERRAAEVWLHSRVTSSPYAEVRTTSRKEYRRR
jgi:hypothetical protein